MELLYDAIVLVVMLVISAFFSSAEVAIVGLSKARIGLIAQDHPGWRSERLRRLKEKQERTIITILIGNNLVNVGASAFAASVFLTLFGNWGVALATGVMTFALLTFGEIIPKTVVMGNKERYALFVSTPLYYMGKVLSPIVTFFEILSRHVPLKRKSLYPVITEEELEALVKVGEKVGEVRGVEREYILRMLEFGDTTAADIMKKRKDIFAMPAEATVAELVKGLEKRGDKFRRVPVYEENLNNVIGIAHWKDVFEEVKRGNTGLPLKRMVRKVHKVHPAKRIDELLKELQKKNRHMAIVVDEKGEAVGLVTLEDILEEIVGEIYDECEQEIKEREELKKG
jgi:putative hemolysin